MIASVLLLENKELVLLGRIELPASSLPMRRSTTELQQQHKNLLVFMRCSVHRQVFLLTLEK